MLIKYLNIRNLTQILSSYKNLLFILFPLGSLNYIVIIFYSFAEGSYGMDFNFNIIKKFIAYVHFKNKNKKYKVMILKKE